MIGKVSMWHEPKGYGFITPDEGGEDVFFHFSKLADRNLKRNMVEGLEVQFELAAGPKGPNAVNVESI